MAERSPVPLIPSLAPDDLAGRIELLRGQAEREGQPLVAYLLEMAMLEAKKRSPGRTGKGRARVRVLNRE